MVEKKNRSWNFIVENLHEWVKSLRIKYILYKISNYNEKKSNCSEKFSSLLGFQT